MSNIFLIWLHVRKVRNLLAAICGCAAVLMMSGTFAQAQTWPTKPVKWLVPFPAGSASDAEARMLTEKLSKMWSQQVLVDNRPGGFTVLAATEAARAKPDGYTLLQAVDFTWTMNQFMFATPRYDPLRDFTHIIQLARLPMAIFANNNTSAKSTAELIALAKASPGKISIGGTGPILQVGVEKFSRDAAIKLLYIAYKGGADVMKGLLSGEIDLGYDSITAYPPFLKSGRLRAIATTGAQRAASLPDVPSLRELGFQNSVFYVWHTLSAPAGLPKEIAAKIERDLSAVLAQPDTKERLTVFGFEPMTSTSEQFIEAIKQESAAGSAIIKELGLKLD